MYDLHIAIIDELHDHAFGTHVEYLCPIITIGLKSGATQGTDHQFARFGGTTISLSELLDQRIYLTFHAGSSLLVQLAPDFQIRIFGFDVSDEYDSLGGRLHMLAHLDADARL